MAEYKEDLKTFSRRSDSNRLFKPYEYQGKYERARLDISLYRNYISITVNNRTINDIKEEGLFRSCNIPIDIAEFIFTFIKSSLLALEEGKSIDIPITRYDVQTKSTMLVCDLIVSRDELSYYIGAKFPQQKNVKFQLMPNVSAKQWDIMVNNKKIDTLKISYVYAISYFTRVLNYITSIRDERDNLLNKAYPITIKDDNITATPEIKDNRIQEEPKKQNNEEVKNSNEIKVEEDFDMDIL